MDYQPPYDNLNIYYLKGRIKGDPFQGDEAYIGNWEEEGYSFLFFKAPAEDRIERLLNAQSGLAFEQQFKMTYEEWQGGSIAPFQVGRLRIIPPWHASAASVLEDTVLLDPGVVFGTGTHPTTHDCLEALQLVYERQPPAKVMDLGTGTGLLALAAARLGASRVLAVDFNRLAAQTARRNVAYNRMARYVLVVQGNAMNFMDASADLMVSNIHYDVMRQLVAAPGFSLQKQFVLSGLLRTQAREIMARLQQQRSVEIIRTWDRDNTWYTIYGRNTA